MVAAFVASWWLMLLMILFLLASAATIVAIGVGMSSGGSLWPDDALPMPRSCPRCGRSTGENGEWYYLRAGGKTRCRRCRTAFKEHPNGSLVEDRES